MPYRKGLYLLLLITLLFLRFTSFAQQLPLEDILKIYHSDSSSIRQLCADKHFTLKQAKNDGAATSFKFEANDSSKTTLEVIFPKDTTTNTVRLNYHFDNKKEYSYLQKAFKENGFTGQTINQGQVPPSSHAERYINKDLQIEFIRSETTPHYWLFLHHAGEYNW